MLKKSRNLCIYPNVYLMDQFSSQIRVLRPISVDKTEATIYCIAPKGERAPPRPPPAPVRRLLQRHRHGHPDDLEEFRSCQHGFNARAVKWNDMTRGATHWVKGRTRTPTSSASSPNCLVHQDRRRRPVRHAARVLARNHEKPISPNKPNKTEPSDAVLRSHSIFCFPEAVPLTNAAGPTGWSSTPKTSSSGCRRGMTTTPDQRSAAEVSLIYYASRSGLEDRIFRIETERSSATIPDTRHGKSISNLGCWPRTKNSVKLRFNWIDQQLPLRHPGHLLRLLRVHPGHVRRKPVIKKKYVVLKNDYIHHVLDIYHI